MLTPHQALGMTYTTAFVLVVMAVMTHLLVLLVFMTLLHHERVANIAARRPREAEEEFSRTSEASVSDVKEIVSYKEIN
jgi:hypothetical protein